MFKTRFVYYLVVLLSICSCSHEDSYVIQGRLRCVRSSMAYLLENDLLGNLVVVDSVPIHGGAFKFKGHVDHPTMRFIRVGTRPPFDVFVENSNIKVTGSLLLPDEIKVEGSSSHNDFCYLSQEFRSMNNKRNSIMVQLTNAKKNKDQKSIARFAKMYNSYPDSILMMTKRFVETHPTSIGAAYFVCYLSQSVLIAKLDDIIGAFDYNIGKNPYIQYLKAEQVLNRKMVVGMDAPEFSLPTNDEDTVRLNEYEGKYLFLDFGASWCEATYGRMERLKSIHEGFCDEGFDVLSISLDDDEELWKQMINDIGVLPWKYACDFLYWSSPVTKYYRVKSIPFGVLIDTDGKIVMINPTLPAMEAYLKKHAN